MTGLTVTIGTVPHLVAAFDDINQSVVTWCGIETGDGDVHRARAEHCCRACVETANDDLHLGKVS